MTSNYAVSVPKLKGRENYSEWAYAAESFLILEGSWNYVTQKPENPEEIAADTKAKAKLVLTIDSKLYVHIKGSNTTKELWEKLKNMFDDAGFTRRISLLRTLISIRLENCSSMTSYVTQIIDTSQKLSGSGFDINDEWVGSLLLAGLTEKYSPMIMAIEHSGIAITADAIKTKLMDLEEDSGDTGDASGAFASFRKQKSGNTVITKDNRYPHTSNSNMSKSKPKVIKCYNCKQTGHYRNQCPSFNKDSSNNKSHERKQTNAFSAVFLNGNFSKNDWYIDSGASAHLTTNEHWIKNVSTEHPIKEIVVANKETVPVKCSGDVSIATLTDNSEYDVIVEEVLCVPNLTTNLISVSQLIVKGNSVQFTNGGCEIYNKSGELVGIASLINGVYKLRQPEALMAAVMDSSDIWHRRLGHVNSNYLNKMQDAVEGLTLDRKTDITKSSCVVCCEGKQSRLPFPNNNNRSNELIHTIHTDICGPFSPSLGGSRYYILFVDDYSRMVYVYFIKQKSEAFACFQKYKAMVENQLNRKIKILRSDNGKEYCNKDFDNYLAKEGIIHQRSNPYTPEQNSLAERFNRTVVEKARCLLFDAGLEDSFWAEATHTAVYLQNRTVASALNGRTPFELWTGMKPNVSHLRIFGSTIMVHIPKQKRLKWHKKAEKCILVGYSEEVKGYRVYNPRTKEITTSRDVTVMEKTMQAEDSVQNEEETESGSSSIELPVVSVEECNSVEHSEADSETEYSPDNEVTQETFYEADGDETYIPETSSTSSSPMTEPEDLDTRNRPRRERRQPDWYNPTGLLAATDSELTIKEALSGSESVQWRQAMDEEWESFQKNEVFELVDAPKGATIVQCRWVLKKKFKSDSEVQYRARLVAKGFTQKYGLDYDLTFSPVVRHSTLRLLFALSVKLDLEVTHLDVKTAYLNGHLKEDIYMCAPVRNLAV